MDQVSCIVCYTPNPSESRASRVDPLPVHWYYELFRTPA